MKVGLMRWIITMWIVVGLKYFAGLKVKTIIDIHQESISLIYFFIRQYPL